MKPKYQITVYLDIAPIIAGNALHMGSAGLKAPHFQYAK